MCGRVISRDAHSGEGADVLHSKLQMYLFWMYKGFSSSVSYKPVGMEIATDI